MTAISLINPYAPQPAHPAGPDAGFAPPHITPPVKETTADGFFDTASNHSGQGAGSGTGTGGAQLEALLRRGREAFALQHPTPRSIVEAQSQAGPTTEFLERQARQRIAARAADDARAADVAAAQAAQAEAEAAKAAEPEFVMPNPLPTAPILQSDPE